MVPVSPALRTSWATVAIAALAAGDSTALLNAKARSDFSVTFGLRVGFEVDWVRVTVGASVDDGVADTCWLGWLDGETVGVAETCGGVASLAVPALPWTTHHPAPARSASRTRTSGTSPRRRRRRG